MKRLFTFFLMGMSAAAIAQQGSSPFGSAQLLPESRQILAEQIASHKTAKLSVAQARLIAFTETFTGYSTDSLTYSYSNGRGSDIMGLLSGPYIGMSDDGYLFCSADSMWRFSTPPMMPDGQQAFRYNVSCIYDAVGRLLTSIDWGGNNDKYRYTYTYDAAGYIKTLRQATSPLTQNTFTDQYSEHYRRNSKNQIVFDSFYYAWASAPGWVKNNTYDASNRKILSVRYDWQTGSSTWLKRDSSMYTYYPNNLLKTFVRYQYSGANILVDKDSFGYTGSNPLPTFKISFTANNGAPWSPTLKTVSTLRPDGLIYAGQYTTQFNGSAFVPYENVIGFFNADSTVRRAECYHFTGSTQDAVPYRHLNYYYQKGGTTTTPPPAAVSGPAAVKNLIVYPNPAGECVFVSIPEAKGNSCRLELLDAQGRRIISRACSAHGTERIDVNHFPAGWYSVRVWSDEGMIGTGRFVK